MPVSRTRPGPGWLPRLTGAALCLAVAAIHVIDQGGFPGSVTPAYVAAGYYAVEVAGVVTAVVLLAGAARTGWLLAAGVAAGPFTGYLLSRGPGLPGYTSDVGNWADPLGIASLVAESALFALAAPGYVRAAAAGMREPRPPSPRQAQVLRRGARRAFELAVSRGR